MRERNILSKFIEYGLYILAFLLPWQTRWIWSQGILNSGKWEYGTFSLYGTEILLGVLVVMNMFQKLSQPEAGQPLAENLEIKPAYIEASADKKLRRHSSRRGRLRHVIALFFVVACVSIFWAADVTLALHHFITLLEGFVLFWLVVSVKSKFNKLALAVIASATIQAGLGIWQFLSQSIFASKWLGMAWQSAAIPGASVIETVSGRWLRAYGSLPHPNILAGWIVIGLVMGVGVLGNQKTIKPNCFNVLMLLCFNVLMAGLFFTFSRGAWFAFVFVFMFLCFYVFMKKDRVGKIITCKLLVISLITFAVFGLIFKEPFLVRVTGQGRLEARSNQERAGGYKEAGALIKKNWLIGVGVGNYTLAVHNQIDSARPSWAYQPVHNVWLLALAELGVFGFVMWAAINLLFIYYLLFIKRGRFSSWILPSGLALLSVIILSFFDHYFWSLHFGIMVWWLVMGILMATNTYARNDMGGNHCC